MIGVTALRGIMPPCDGIVQKRLQSRATTLPASMEAGISSLWSDACINSRATCGTARPMNEIGPQKAVTMDVSAPVMMRSQLRTTVVRMPKFSA